MHSRYVIWATEKHINGEAFGSEDMDDEREEQRQNIPLHVFKEFISDLAGEVEKAKTDSAGDSKKTEELDLTLRRLKTLATKDHGESKPQLRTLKSRQTLSRVKLVVDDKETTETIRTAMKQIGDSKGRKHEPVNEIQKLASRSTIDARKGNKSNGGMPN